MAQLGDNSKYHLNLRKFVFDDKYKELVKPKEVIIKHYLCGRGSHGSAAKACACYKEGFEEGAKDVDDLNEFANEVGSLRNQLFLKQAKRASDRIDQELQVIESEEVAKSLLALNENALDSIPPADEEAVASALEMPPLEEMDKVCSDAREWPDVVNEVELKPKLESFESRQEGGALKMEKIVVGRQEAEKINWDVPEWPTAQNDVVEQPPMK